MRGRACEVQTHSSIKCSIDRVRYKKNERKRGSKTVKGVQKKVKRKGRKERKRRDIYTHTHTHTHIHLVGGLGSSVGLATELRTGRSGIESRWGRDFPPVQTGSGAHPASCKMDAGSFPGVKFGRGVLLTTHPLLVLRSWKSRAIPLPTLWATPGL